MTTTGWLRGMMVAVLMALAGLSITGCSQPRGQSPRASIPGAGSLPTAPAEHEDGNAGQDLSPMTPLAQGSDVDLVQRAKQGDKEAFTGLVDRHLSSLVSFFRYLRVPEDLIDDLVQETFTRAFLNLASYDNKGSLNSWLLTIGKNHYLDIWRKRAKERAWSQTAVAEPFSDAGEIALAQNSVQALLYTLPADLKLLVELRVFQELPFAEIGKITGETEGNVRVKFHRTMQRLRLTLEKEENHGPPESV